VFSIYCDIIFNSIRINNEGEFLKELQLYSYNIIGIDNEKMTALT